MEVFSPATPPSSPHPEWLQRIFDSYNSGAKNVFLLHGNTQDIFQGAKTTLSLRDYLTEQVASREIIVHADPAEGLRVIQGGDFLGDYAVGSNAPLADVGRILLFLANLPEAHHAAVIVTNAGYAVGKDNNPFDSLLVKRWAEDPHLRRDKPFVALITGSYHEIHPIIRDCNRIETQEVPLPNPAQIDRYLKANEQTFPKALAGTQEEPLHKSLVDALCGTSMEGLESLLKKQEYSKKPLRPEELGGLKRTIVTRESRGMLEFLPTTNTLADLSGETISAVRAQFEGDIALWKTGGIDLMPNGYLLCGPPGTGKTFFVRCLSGSAGIPVIKINNFRGEYQGATESNLELIFRLAKTLPRAYLFIDEAEQWLGSRSQSSSDGGVSARVYSYFAQEMSNPENRGRLCWILATSHPHLLEIDLKRPGRIDVKIPLFPSNGPTEGKKLLSEVCKRKGIVLSDNPGRIPDLLTPGAADSLAAEIIRQKIKNNAANEADLIRSVLENYQGPNEEKTRSLIQAAVEESSSMEFIPKSWKEQQV